MSRGQRIALIAVIVYALCGIIAAKWLAGLIFFLLHRAAPEAVRPETWSIYWHYYSENVAERKRLMASALIAVAAIYVIPTLIIAHIAAGKPRSLHGDARFATTRDVVKAGLFGEEGIIIGKIGNQYLIFGGQQFVLLAAPTRSGKGVAMVIPNLLHFAGSVVVLDIKLENFRLTSKFRQAHGQTVFLFNPFAEDCRTHRWNPLDNIARDPNLRVDDILSIGQVLYPSDQQRDAFWNDQARNLFLGLTLYLLETPTLICSFGEILRQSSGKGKPLKAHLEEIISTRAKGPTPLSPECVDALLRFCMTSENTLSSILATLNAPLTIFASPVVDAATSHSDFDLSHVRRRLISVYIGIQPHKLADASLLINLFFSQLINLNTRVLPQDDLTLKHQCLVILDEFTSIGKVGIMARANAFISGYNLRLLTIMQSVAQLESVYGEKDARTLLTNHAVQVIFAPREQRDANTYSEMLGYYTEAAISKGISHARGGQGGGSSSENTSQQRRALLLPQELKDLKPNDQIVLLENTKPIRCQKTIFYNDLNFTNRLRSVSPNLTVLKRHTLPSRDDLERAVRTDLAVTPAPLNMDLFIAKSEGRMRPVRSGEVVDLDMLVIEPDLIPPVTDQTHPEFENISAIVAAFEAQATWIEAEDATSSISVTNKPAVNIHTGRPKSDSAEIKPSPRRRTWQQRGPIDMSLITQENA